MENYKKQTWLIDPVHSRIRFEATYLMISKVSGWFRSFEGEVITEAKDFNSSELKIILYTHSIDTGSEERDNHLKSPDFLDSAHFPTIKLISEEIKTEGNIVQVKGRLFIKQEQIPVEFTAEYVGARHDEMGNEKAGFSSSFILNRNALDIGWNKKFGNNNLLISSNITLNCDIQLLKSE